MSTELVAYLDPGTGSVLIGAIAAAGASVAVFFRRAMDMFRYRSKPSSDLVEEAEDDGAPAGDF